MGRGSRSRVRGAIQRRLAGDPGATTTEYLGIILAVVAVVLALLWASPGLSASVTTGIRNAVCAVTGEACAGAGGQLAGTPSRPSVVCDDRLRAAARRRRPSGARQLPSPQLRGRAVTVRAAGFVVLLVLMGACGGDEPDAAPLPEGAVEVSRPGVSLVAPPGWEVRDDGEPLHPASVVDLQPVGADSVTPGVFVVTEAGNVAAALDIEAFTAAFTGQQRLTIPGYELLDSEPVDVPGARQAMRLVIDYDDDGVPHRELALIALVGEVDQVVVRAAAPIAELPDVEEDLQAILASVRVDADGFHADGA